MEHYVTLFDGLFLPQGLALHRSMERHAGSYTLWILCVDRAAFDALATLQLANVRLLLAEELETEELRQARSSRTRAEYCWTLTPQAPGFVFAADPSVARVTYLDADLWLFRSPQAIFEEFEASGKSVLITEHAYAPDYDQTAMSGRFCVQFITFIRDRGEHVRRWWAERCLEWCYARMEDGKFGDQKYLDDWPDRFSSDVHVLLRKDLIVAPWNATRFPYSSMVAYHFHGLRLLRGGRVMLARGYEIPKPTQIGAYQPYLRDLACGVAALKAIGYEVRAQAQRPGLHVLVGVLVRKLQRILARMNPMVTARLPLDRGKD
jgi:hypothetical protein